MTTTQNSKLRLNFRTKSDGFQKRMHADFARNSGVSKMFPCFVRIFGHRTCLRAASQRRHLFHPGTPRFSCEMVKVSTDCRVWNPAIFVRKLGENSKLTAVVSCRFLSFPQRRGKASLGRRGRARTPSPSRPGADSTRSECWDSTPPRHWAGHRCPPACRHR